MKNNLETIAEYLKNKYSEKAIKVNKIYGIIDVSVRPDKLIRLMPHANMAFPYYVNPIGEITMTHADWHKLYSDVITYQKTSFFKDYFLPIIVVQGETQNLKRIIRTFKKHGYNPPYNLMVEQNFHSIEIDLRDKSIKEKR